MDLRFAVTLAMLATAGAGAGLAGVLLARGRAAPGAVPLAVFLLTVGAWAVGLILPNRIGAALMCLAPVAGAAFVEFAVRLAEGPVRLIRPVRLAGLAAAGLALPAPGVFVPWQGGLLFRYEGAGWIATGVTVALAGLGHGLLIRGWRRSGARQRRQIGLVIASALLGLAASSALVLPVLEIDAAPWMLLAMPLYVALLAYGVLRYELMAVNLWTRRALSGALVMLAAGSGAALLAGGLAGDAWLVAVIAAGLALGLALPARRVMERLIYPGGEVTAATLARWRQELTAAEAAEEITRRAEALLAVHLGLPPDAALPPVAEAPPGPRRAYDLMADLVAGAQADLARRREFADRARLAELGALAATVAHDLRNPMNILGMAVAGSDPATRAEVRAQLSRMEALVRDLLDYAKPWAVTPVDVELTGLVAGLVRGRPIAVEIPDGLMVRADPMRLGQALDNLLTNAAHAGAEVRVTARADAEGVEIAVSDDGPGIPADIRADLFRPFVSRTPGGTGLGLAIVAKVMAAHGGTVSLSAPDDGGIFEGADRNRSAQSSEDSQLQDKGAALEPGRAVAALHPPFLIRNPGQGTASLVGYGAKPRSGNGPAGHEVQSSDDGRTCFVMRFPR